MANVFDSNPSLTIGMPVKDRVCNIRRVLEGIENLDYPKSQIKLIFVDAFSVDGTYEIIVSWKKKLERYYQDILLIQKKTNIPQARNICINNVCGDFILFWDSDVIPPRDLLKQMLNALISDEKAGIIGADYIYEHKDFFTKIMGQQIVNGKASYAFMGFTLIRMKIFAKIGLFNETLNRGEDEELVLRLLEETDYKTLWAPKPVLHLKESASLNFLLKWSLYNAFWKRGAECAESFPSLPLFLKLRLIYYGMLPIFFVLGVFTSFCYHSIWIFLLLVIYVLSGMLVAIRKSNIRRGTLLFFTFDAPVGIAVSYGTIVNLAKTLFRRQKKTSGTSMTK